MRYSFTVNQKAIIDNNLNIDVIDACLIDYLVMFSMSNSIIKIHEDGKTFFFFSHDKIVEDCPILGLKKDSVYRRLKKLSDIGLLEQYSKSKVIKMTMYSITDKVQLLYNQNKSDTSETHPINIGNSSVRHTDENPMYSNISNNSYINNNIYSKNENFQEQLNFDNLNTEPKKEKVFSIPTVEEIKQYCIERNNIVDPQKFFDFYESKGWMIGRSKMKDWKASIRTWERSSNNKNNSNNGNTTYQQPGIKKQYQYDHERAMQALLGKTQ